MTVETNLIGKDLLEGAQLIRDKPPDCKIKLQLDFLDFTVTGLNKMFSDVDEQEQISKAATLDLGYNLEPGYLANKGDLEKDVRMQQPLNFLNTNPKINDICKELNKRDDFLNNSMSEETEDDGRPFTLNEPLNFIFPSEDTALTPYERCKQLKGITPSQERILEIFSIHATRFFLCENDIDQLLMLIQGGPGVGKTWVTRKMMEILDLCKIGYLTVAASGAAASCYFNAETIHTAFSVQIKTEGPSNFYDKPLQKQPLENLIKRLNEPAIKVYLFIDEISQVGATMLAKLSERCKEACTPDEKGLMFAGFNVVMIGDFWQMPPVGGKPLYIDLLHFHHMHLKLPTLKSEKDGQLDLEDANKPRFDGVMAFKGALLFILFFLAFKITYISILKMNI